MQGQQIQRSNAPGRGDVPVRYNPPQGQVMMRQMTRDDFKGPVPVMIGPEELAAIERAHWENERQLKMGERQTEQATRSGKMVVVGMCCVAGFEIAQMCVVIVFLLEHEDFCNQYWENTVDGVYTSPFDGDKFWPVLNGQAKTYLWTWVYLLTLSVNCLINLGALTSHLICSRTLDNTCHAFMQYIITILHFITGAFALAWCIVGAIWTFGNKVIPWECKNEEMGNNDFYIFMAVIIILALISWPLFCVILAAKSRYWWHDPKEGDELLRNHWNNQPKPERSDPKKDFEKFGYMA